MIFAIVLIAALSSEQTGEEYDGRRALILVPSEPTSQRRCCPKACAITLLTTLLFAPASGVIGRIQLHHGPAKTAGLSSFSLEATLLPKDSEHSVAPRKATGIRKPEHQEYDHLRNKIREECIIWDRIFDVDLKTRLCAGDKRLHDMDDWEIVKTNCC